jgi:hypothetical protein
VAAKPVDLMLADVTEHLIGAAGAVYHKDLFFN